MSAKRKVNSALHNFLNKRSRKGNDVITHTRIGDKKQIAGGSYSIKDTDEEAFLKLYFDEIFSNKADEYLTERQLESGGPIAIDIDFRYKISVDKRCHTEKHIFDIVNLYFEELQTMFEFERGMDIPVYIFEKKKVNILPSKEITKDGIHIIIGLKVVRNCAITLRKRIMANIHTIWNDLPIENTWDEVFDEGITKGSTNWQLYGSKKPDNLAYELTSVYQVGFDNDLLQYRKIESRSMETEENFPKLSVRYKMHDEFFMKNDFIIELEDTFRAQAPRLPMEEMNYENVLPMYSNVENILRITNRQELEQCLTIFRSSIADKNNFQEIYEYTMILPKTFYDTGSYFKWIRVGMALCNIDKRLFIVWVAISAKVENFNFSTIHDLWNKWQSFTTAGSAGLTKRSIMFWGREENPTDYYEVLKKSTNYQIDVVLIRVMQEKRTHLGDRDIVDILHHLYKEDYLCASIKTKSWYQFKNHRWMEEESGVSLHNQIGDEFKKIFFQKMLSVVKDFNSIEDETKKGCLVLQKKILENLLTTLSQESKVNVIMVTAMYIFYDPSFLDKLDQDPYLLCFNNGVIDFKAKEYRQGRPEDYISKCTNIQYITTNATHEVIIGEINDFMTKLFPDPQLLEYMWSHLSSTLLGVCREQTINMYIGIGQNGKSVLVNLMEHVLGDYKGDVPLTLLTQPRTKIGGLSPELVQLKGVRYAVIQEPSKGDRINEGIMKQLTGGDPIQARSPYMLKTLTFVPQFKLVVCSNEFMVIRSQDHGTWRRIRVVDFEALFTENPKQGDESKPYQYILDKDIKEKFNSWKEVFASLLVNHAFQIDGKVQDCPKVLASRDAYKESQDCIAEFINAYLAPDIGSTISKMIVADKFREWYECTYGSPNGNKLPNLKDISIQIEKIYGRLMDGQWLNVQWKSLLRKT